jgi:thiamine biosynthesis lipoprotein ApbE
MLVDLGGNLRSVSGEWTIGLHGGGETFVLKSGEAVATSGEYFRGKHIKNARTGGDIEKPVYSVSVIYPESAMMADALSTVMFIFGREKGAAFLKAHCPSAKAVWIGSKH